MLRETYNGVQNSQFFQDDIKDKEIFGLLGLVVLPSVEKHSGISSFFLLGQKLYPKKDRRSYYFY